MAHGGKEAEAEHQNGHSDGIVGILPRHLLLPISVPDYPGGDRRCRLWKFRCVHFHVCVFSRCGKSLLWVGLPGGRSSEALLKGQQPELRRGEKRLDQVLHLGPLGRNHYPHVYSSRRREIHRPTLPNLLRNFYSEYRIVGALFYYCWPHCSSRSHSWQKSLLSLRLLDGTVHDYRKESTEPCSMAISPSKSRQAPMRGLQDLFEELPDES